MFILQILVVKMLGSDKGLSMEANFKCIWF